jgi:hypothetical protein
VTGNHKNPAFDGLTLKKVDANTVDVTYKKGGEGRSDQSYGGFKRWEGDELDRQADR